VQLAPSQSGNVMRFGTREGFAICRVSLRGRLRRGCLLSPLYRLLGRRPIGETLTQSLIHRLTKPEGVRRCVDLTKRRKVDRVLPRIYRVLWIISCARIIKGCDTAGKLPLGFYLTWSERAGAGWEGRSPAIEAIHFCGEKGTME
jgi:hypothetical protein